MKNLKTSANAFYQTVDSIGAGDADINAFDNVAAPDFKAHLPDGTTVDREGFKNIVKAFGLGFPAATHTIEDIIAEGNKVTVRMTWHGIHKGTFQSFAATGNSISMSEMGVLRIENGKVTEFWPLFDSMTLMQGVGAAGK